VWSRLCFAVDRFLYRQGLLQHWLCCAHSVCQISATSIHAEDKHEVKKHALKSSTAIAQSTAAPSAACGCVAPTGSIPVADG
jgi:hypothetical protein